MSWGYSQTSGELIQDGTVIGSGYSGRGEGLNNPELQDVADVGPIPQGTYTIGEALTDPEKGPLAMHLVPDASNDMFGRAGFMIHGDNQMMNHSASEGCIILSHDLRSQIANSGDSLLIVSV